MISAVTELDPTPRRLASREKYNRSMRLVSLASEALRACRTPESDAGETLLKEADQLKAKRVEGPITNEFSESRLKLAEDLWGTRLTACTSSPSEDDPLSWVMNRLRVRATHVSPMNQPFRTMAAASWPDSSAPFHESLPLVKRGPVRVFTGKEYVFYGVASFAAMLVNCPGR